MKLAPGRFFGRTLLQRQSAGLTLNVSRYQPGREQPWHVHTHPTLFIPVLGNHRDQTRSSARDQRELSLVFHPTCEPHAGIVGLDGLIGLNLEFEPGWLAQHELEDSDLGGYRLVEPSVWVRLSVLRLVCLSFQSALDDWGERNAQALELIEPLVNHEVPSGSPRWLRRAEDYLHEEFRSSISLRDAAREAGVHPVYFARVFRRRHGCPVSAYLRALRLAEAGRLILRDGQSLAQAAVIAGFADQSHLSRCFSRQFGFTPSAVRSAGDFLRA